MAAKIVDAGLAEILGQCRTAWNATEVRIHLFKSNTTPTTSSVLADFTESTFAGYAAQDLDNWSVPSASAHVETTTADPVTFTRSSTGTAENIYGYFVTDPSDTILLWAERDPNAPIVVVNAGDSYTVTAALSIKDIST